MGSRVCRKRGQLLLTILLPGEWTGTSPGRSGNKQSCNKEGRQDNCQSELFHNSDGHGSGSSTQKIQDQTTVVERIQSVNRHRCKAVTQMENERAGIKGEMAYHYPIDMNCFPHGGNISE